jgi:hypothetical protein
LKSDRLFSIKVIIAGEDFPNLATYFIHCAFLLLSTGDEYATLHTSHAGRSEFLRFATGSGVVPPFGLRPVKVIISRCCSCEYLYEYCNASRF